MFRCGLVKLLPVLRMALGCLIIVALYSALQSPAVGICSALLSCPEPAANGYQPYPAAMIDLFDRAGTNRLGNDSPTLPQIFKGYPSAQGKMVSPYVPCILLKAMGHHESPGWKQFDAAYGQSGATVISPDCGYGIMQITSGMDGSGDFNPSRVAAEPAYNIGTAAQILIQKWNQVVHYIGANDPAVAENWYYAVWAYNGGITVSGTLTWGGNPNNPVFPTARGPWLCDGQQNRAQWPYQEQIWGCVAHPLVDPANPNSEIWQATQLSFPSRGDVFTSVGGPPPEHIETPLPAHGSCSVTSLPTLFKNYAVCSQGASLIQNGDFEQGSVVWSEQTSTPPIIRSTLPVSPTSGVWAAWLAGFDNANETLQQDFLVPLNTEEIQLRYWVWIAGWDDRYVPYDHVYVRLRDTSGALIYQIDDVHNALDRGVWIDQWISVLGINQHVGQTLRLSFEATTDNSKPTHFVVDDVRLTMHCGSGSGPLRTVLLQSTPGLRADPPNPLNPKP